MRLLRAIRRPAEHPNPPRGSPHRAAPRPPLLSPWSRGSVRWASSGAGPGGEDPGDRESGTRLLPWSRRPDPIRGQWWPKEVGGLRPDEPRNASGPAAQEVPLKVGDLVLAELRRRHGLESRKMFALAAGGALHSKWGVLAHRDLLGHLPGQVFSTSTGFEFVLRRPSLEEFVLLMKRGPAISYPKDASTMVMMMDVGLGDCVLESGTGSGAMTLFLSRAVGPSGHVYSFEMRKDHQGRAERNYQRWRNAYEVAREREWPKNVDFIHKDIVFATDVIQGKMFDAIALDMLSPQLALPVISTHLKQGGICAVYLTSITQVIDLLEGIRTSQLSLLCEKILEVIHRDWFVIPALRKDGSTATRVESQRSKIDLQHKEGNDTAKIEDHDEDGNTKPFCTVPYIARPHHEQVSHTAFLIKLRKFKTALQ